MKFFFQGSISQIYYPLPSIPSSWPMKKYWQQVEQPKFSSLSLIHLHLSTFYVSHLSFTWGWSTWLNIVEPFLILLFVFDFSLSTPNFIDESKDRFCFVIAEDKVRLLKILRLFSPVSFCHVSLFVYPITSSHARCRGYLSFLFIEVEGSFFPILHRPKRF